jgi:putative ABC transport system ATP-binding protein
MTVIGGPSGAGKTTLLSLLSRAVDPIAGTIRHGGIALTGLSPARSAAWRRASVGLVFQTSRLINVMSAREHIALAARLRPGRRDETLSRGLALLERLGLGDRLDHMPAHLSGGEKQRVALAQALCFRPSIVLADEPTASLDAANGALIAETLHDHAHAHGAVVVCVSHDALLRSRADSGFDLEKP